jgi:ligand-binding sensor domain-containing protein
MKHPKHLHPSNAEELAAIAQETGAEVLRGALRYPSESGGWQLGGGLSLWDGETWHSYRVSNSEISFNTVQAISEAEPGILWVGTALPNNVGGVLATFDGEKWTTYTPRNSGFSGAEPLAIAQDEQQRVWVGTRTGGVDLYQPRR